MIEVKELRKSYTTGDFVQKALDGVSISFRDSEFAAILGTSGSGKTTLLNIIGGLDHADSGEILIDGVSTKNYKASDWNTYRNHHIGFIFQSYNLIPHQTVLSNVELALTLSGVGSVERKKRAREALEKVGLEDHVNKKPAQLSGGQAQRVAIARAIVNDPDIVLADEPTGALDTETGIQVMDILAEIAKDRLVIMVTHNPELADKYATRIIRLKDGHVLDDSMPILDGNPEESPTEDGSDARDVPMAPVPIAVSSVSNEPNSKDNLKSKKAKMSFLTALELSFSNLMTKKGRTFMTAFAGSIGIIGIAAILSLSNGVNNYIAATEEEALSSYPLTITKSAFNLSSLLSATITANTQEGVSSAEDISMTSAIPESAIMSDMFAEVKSNDLASFKEYLESGKSDIDKYVNTIRYRYDITPRSYIENADGKYVQVNPSKAGSSFSNDLMSSSFSLSSSSTDSFTELLNNEETVQKQNTLLCGKWPESYDECVLVLDKQGKISDYTLYAIGVYDTEVLNDMFKKMLSGQTVDVPEHESSFSYEDALNLTYKVVPEYSIYRKNTDSDTWHDATSDEDNLAEIAGDGINLKVVGVIKPADDFTGNPITEGIAYMPSLTYKLMDMAADAEIVKQQMANPDVDVFTGKTFEELQDEQNRKLDMESMFSIDEDKMASAFSFDESALSNLGSGFDASSLDMSSAMSAFDMSDIPLDYSPITEVFSNETMASIMANAPAFDAKTMASSLALDDAQRQELYGIADELSASFTAWMIINGKTMPSGSAGYADLFQEYMNDPSSGATEILSKAQAEFGDDVEAAITSAFSSYFESALAPYLADQFSVLIQVAIEKMMTQAAESMASQVENASQSIGYALSGAIAEQMNGMSDLLSDSFSFNSDAFADAIKVNMSEEELAGMIASLMTSEEFSYDNNLVKLGYAEESNPKSISLYPIDFPSKEKVLEIIDDYNAEQEDAGNDDAVIQYTDIVGALMSSVTSIVDTISIVLIAFVSISLVVSSIMIGIITYISVLERRKEIGILRAMGASAGNIANVFNAETIIEGFISGVIAISLVLIVSIPVNIAVYDGFDVPNVMTLPPTAAIALVGISVFLTFIAGLIPSQSASHKDPVEALRSE